MRQNYNILVSLMEQCTPTVTREPDEKGLLYKQSSGALALALVKGLHAGL